MKKKALWISGVLTTAIMLIMNFVLIPKIESTTEGIRCFDMQSFGYSHETALRFLSLLGEEGRSIYLHQQLPLDFIYPIVYTVFFLLLIDLLVSSMKNSNKIIRSENIGTKIMKSEKKKYLIYVPVCLLPLFDYGENFCTLSMLKSLNPSVQLTGLASKLTMIKSVLMYLVFAILIILISMRIYEKIRKNHSDRSKNS